MQQVRKQHPSAEFNVHWLPYQLNPSAAEEGVSKMQYYNDKFGPARVAQMMPAMAVSVMKGSLCKVQMRLLIIWCASCVNTAGASLCGCCS